MEIPPSHIHAARLYGAEFAANPVEAYQEIRRRHGRVAPVLLEGDVPAWMVLAYRELHHVTSNPQLFGRDSRRWNLWDQIPSDWPLMPFVAWAPAVLLSEGADHQRRAGAISDALEAVDRVELTRLCERTADQLIDTFAPDGKADLLTQYAQPLPIMVIARLFGLPEKEVAGLSADLLLATTQQEGSIEANQRAVGVIGALVKERRERPGTGLPARLLAHPAAMTDEELTMDMYIMAAAGQQPTTDWIANTLRLMLMDDQFSLTLQGGRISADHALIEVLWTDSPSQNLVGRWAVQDCELGGRRIRKGDLLVLGLQAANSDPQVRPDSYAGAGLNRAHMSFANGEHSCPIPAREIAELIARTAIEVLLDRAPDVELAVPAAVLEWRESVWTRGLNSLPVSFTPVTEPVRRLSRSVPTHGAALITPGLRPPHRCARPHPLSHRHIRPASTTTRCVNRPT
jgi:cytochrome P450